MDSAEQKWFKSCIKICRQQSHGLLLVTVQAQILKCERPCKSLIGRMDSVVFMQLFFRTAVFVAALDFTEPSGTKKLHCLCLKLNKTGFMCQIAFMVTDNSYWQGLLTGSNLEGRAWLEQHPPSLFSFCILKQTSLRLLLAYL